MLQDWSSITLDALQNVWRGMVGFIPLLLGAVIIFLVGWLVSTAVGKLVAMLLNKVGFNRIFERSAWKAALDKAEIKVNPAQFVGGVVKWVLVIVFLLAAVEILGLVQFAGYLQSILDYLPNVVVAAFILVVTVIVTDIIEKVVRTTVEGIKVGYGKLVSEVIKWSIWVFAILAVLTQLGIAKSFMETLFTGIVAMLALAFGIAFGLGGKEVASDIWKGVRNKIKD